MAIHTVIMTFFGNELTFVIYETTGQFFSGKPKCIEVLYTLCWQACNVRYQVCLDKVPSLEFTQLRK